MIRAFRIALYLQAVWFFIKLQVLSEQSEKVTCVVLFVAGKVKKENVLSRLRNSLDSSNKLCVFSLPFVVSQRVTDGEV